MVPRTFSSFGITFFCLGGIFIETLQKYAITLIYPDGSVEKIPITHHHFHIKYYSLHWKKSKRFAAMVYKLRINTDDISTMDDNFEKIKSILGINDVLIIENLNIFDIVENQAFLEENLCDFAIYFPKYFKSKEQLENYINFVGDYPDELLYFGRFDKNENTHSDITREQMKEFLNEEKEKFGIEDLKR